MKTHIPWMQHAYTNLSVYLNNKFVYVIRPPEKGECLGKLYISFCVRAYFLQLQWSNLQNYGYGTDLTHH